MSFFSIYATKRSGHHAFIEWLCDSLSGNWIYLNNLSFIDGEVCFAKGESSLNVRVRPGPVRVALESWSDKVDHVIVSYENIKKDQLSKFIDFEKSVKYRRGEDEHIKIVFLRDFFNSYASQFSWFEKNGKQIGIDSIERFKGSWSCLAEIFISKLNGRESLLGCDIVVSSYNRFVFDDAFRSSLAKKLNITSSLLRQDLSKFGGGGNTFFSKPEDYKVDKNSLESRWQMVENIDVFVSSMDEDLLLLAKEFSHAINRPDLYSDPYEKLFLSVAK